MLATHPRRTFAPHFPCFRHLYVLVSCPPVSTPQNGPNTPLDPSFGLPSCGLIVGCSIFGYVAQIAILRALYPVQPPTFLWFPPLSLGLSLTVLPLVVLLGGLTSEWPKHTPKPEFWPPPIPVALLWVGWVCALCRDIAHPCARSGGTVLCTFSCPVCSLATDICSFAPPFSRVPDLVCPGVLSSAYPGFEPPAGGNS